MKIVKKAPKTMAQTAQEKAAKNQRRARRIAEIKKNKKVYSERPGGCNGCPQ